MLAKPVEGPERRLPRPYGADLGRKNPRFGSESLRSDALAMQELGSTSHYPKPFAHLWHQVCCLPVPSLQRIATVTYVASREDETVIGLALFGNFYLRRAASSRISYLTAGRDDIAPGSIEV
jgi:hypothetical protein